MGNAIASAIKLVLAILLLPFVIASANNLRIHLIDYPGADHTFFYWGAFAFLMTFLFLYQFWGVFDFGHKIVLSLFKLFSPFDRLIAYSLPFYLILVMVLFYVLGSFFGITNINHYLMFFAGFSLAMHTLLVAQDLREQERNLVKPAYLLSLHIVFLANVSLTVLLFDLNYQTFTFPEFFSNVLDEARQFFLMVFGKNVFW